MIEDKFKWDENNVTELLYHLSKKTNWVHSQMCKWAEDFKQSKLQSQDKQIGWEIVEFKTKDGHLAIKQSEPRFGLHWRVMKGESIGWCSYSTCIEDYNIHSVKRLSDGEVFTIGDEVRYKLNPKSPFIITNFLVKGTDILARSEGNNICEFVDDNLEKTPNPSSIDRIEVTTCGHANWNEPNGGAFIFKTNKPIRYNDFPSEKIKQAIEAVLNGDTVVEDDIVGLLRDCVSSTWGNPSLDRTQELFDKFLLDRKLVNPTLKDVNKTVTKLVNEILLDKKYSQSEVDTIRKESFDAGRNHNGTPKYGFVVWEYPTLQDYLNSLSKETKPKEEDKPVLFITEDGVEIRNGDHAFYVQDDNNWMVVSHSGITEKRPYPYSHTSESANKWVLENKPCLSLNEVKELANNNGAKVLCIPDEKISNYTKQKLNQQ